MSESVYRQALPAGHRLGAYRVVEVLGVGGFGVTYLAHDARLERRLAIKEYLPNEFAVRDGTTVLPKSGGDREDFAWGLSRFLDEARTLARFRHAHLVRVVEYFEANGTAYIAMDYEDGEPLDRLLGRLGSLSEAQLLRIVLPVADGLREVHASGYLHRDIKPSNVYVRRSDESPVLLDFGAARQALGRKSKSLTAVASAGYSPPEQYESDGEQGPWTDVYGLSALCYRAIAGEAPPESPRRQSRLLRGQPDPLRGLSEMSPRGYSRGLLETVDAGLSVLETERPQSLSAWLDGVRGVGGAGESPSRAAVAVRGESRESSAASASGAASSGRGAASRSESSEPSAPSAVRAPSPGVSAPASSGRRRIVFGSAAGALLTFAAFAWFWVASGPESPSRAASPSQQRAVDPLTFRDDLAGGGRGPEMVVIPPGSFRMGSPRGESGRYGDEGPVHRVGIGYAFALGVHEVTFAQWDACAAAGGCRGYRPDDEGWGRGSRPVINVSWNDAKSYVAWLSEKTGEEYRLPSESEWEYAARAGTETRYHWGDGIGRNNANCVSSRCGDDFEYTAPVGSFRANAFGLHDMHGNVWEWVEDCWHGDYRGAPTDGSAWVSNCADSRRVLRGGSWYSIPWGLRAAHRVRYDTDGRNYDVGFRVARRVSRTLAP